MKLLSRLNNFVSNVEVVLITFSLISQYQSLIYFLMRKYFLLLLKICSYINLLLEKLEQFEIFHLKP